MKNERYARNSSVSVVASMSPGAFNSPQLDRKQIPQTESSSPIKHSKNGDTPKFKKELENDAKLKVSSGFDKKS